MRRVRAEKIIKRPRWGRCKDCNAVIVGLDSGRRRVYVDRSTLAPDELEQAKLDKPFPLILFDGDVHAQHADTCIVLQSDRARLQSLINNDPEPTYFEWDEEAIVLTLRQAGRMIFLSPEEQEVMKGVLESKKNG